MVIDGDFSFLGRVINCPDCGSVSLNLSCEFSL